MTEERKRANFERIATKRVNEILNKIDLLKNLANSSYYSMERKDIQKIYNAIALANEETYNSLLNKRGKEFHL